VATLLQYRQQANPEHIAACDNSMFEEHLMYGCQPAETIRPFLLRMVASYMCLNTRHSYSSKQQANLIVSHHTHSETAERVSVVACRHVFWASKADSAVAQEDVGGVHWGLHHDCGGFLVLGWIHVQVQVDDLPTYSMFLLRTRYLYRIVYAF